MKGSLPILLLAVVMLVVLAIPQQSNAFWSRAWYGVHQDITNDSLAQPYMDLKFSERAIEQINDQHAVLDSSKTPYRATDHFDSDKLRGSWDTLKSRRVALIKALKDGNQGSAWRHLGAMLHAVQDFYSHSTWVWTKRDGIVNFGDALRSGVMPPQIAQPSDGGCTESDDTTVSDGTGRISTGFYPPLIAGPRKCSHGKVWGGLLTRDWLKYYDTKNRNQAPPYVRPGIALDYAGAPKRDLVYNQNANTAKMLAVAEGNALISSIINSVHEELGLCGVCLLTDAFDDNLCAEAVEQYAGPGDVCPVGLQVYQIWGTTIRPPIETQLNKTITETYNDPPTLSTRQESYEERLSVSAIRGIELDEYGWDYGVQYNPVVCRIGGVQWVPKVMYAPRKQLEPVPRTSCSTVSPLNSRSVESSSEFRLNESGILSVSETRRTKDVWVCSDGTRNVELREYIATGSVSLQNGEGEVRMHRTSDQTTTHPANSDGKIRIRTYGFDISGTGTWPGQPNFQLYYTESIIGARPLSQLPYKPGDPIPDYCTDAFGEFTDDY